MCTWSIVARRDGRLVWYTTMCTLRMWACTLPSLHIISILALSVLFTRLALWMSIGYSVSGELAITDTVDEIAFDSHV